MLFRPNEQRRQETTRCAWAISFGFSIHIAFIASVIVKVNLDGQENPYSDIYAGLTGLGLFIGSIILLKKCCLRGLQSLERQDANPNNFEPPFLVDFIEEFKTETPGEVKSNNMRSLRRSFTF